MGHPTPNLGGTMEEPKRTTHEDGDPRWYDHDLLTDEDIERYAAEDAEVNPTGQEA